MSEAPALVEGGRIHLFILCIIVAIGGGADWGVARGAGSGGNGGAGVLVGLPSFTGRRPAFLVCLGNFKKKKSEPAVRG